jgi:hypothetical protein
MRKWLLYAILMTVLGFVLIYTDSAEARGIPAVNLNLVPTANTLGKGGYSFWAGMFPYDTEKAPPDPMNVDIGGFFKEMHHVKIQSDIWLYPSRITYGISDRFDLTFGGTYSMGDTDKSISDYYETGDSKERVYSQTVLDGVLGMKYSIQEASVKLPALSVGGEIQMGYTVDDELADDTPGDSFPFVGMLLYMAASYDFEMINVHGGLGMFLSSESVQSDKRFDVPIQVGAEIPFNGLAAVIDIVMFRAFSGVGIENIISGGLRYDISSRAMLNASVVSAGGFLVRLTVGGSKPKAAMAPSSAPTLF